MSSRQQFLKGPGDPGDNDSEVQDSQVDVHDSYSQRYQTLGQTQGILEKELSQKKNLKLNIDQNDPMSAGLIKKNLISNIGSIKKSHGPDSIRSEAHLLQRQLSVKTEKNKVSFIGEGRIDIDDFTEGNNMYKLQPHKSKTLKIHYETGNGRDLMNKNVETNIDPNIIRNQEEEKDIDRYTHDSSNKKSQRTLLNGVSERIGHRKDKSNDNNSQMDKKSDGEILSEKLSSNVVKLLQSKKTDLIKALAEDDDEILDLKLNLDEDPGTQGSIDPLIEVERVKQARFIIIHTGKFRIRWDLWIITLVLYNCIQIPLEIAFQTEFTSNQLDAFGYFVDSQFYIDIFFNFRTTFINEKTGLIVKIPKQIAINYLTQWRFYFDTLSIIPFELLYKASNPNGGTNTTQFKIFDLLKLIRLLRLGRIITYLKVKQDIKVGFRIIQLLSMLLLIVHWSACIWFVIVDGTNWIPPRDCNAGVTEFYDVSMGNQYSLLFYYLILLLLGSDIVPTSSLQVVYGALIALMGSLIFAFIFGNMAALMAAMNQKDSQFQDQFDSITNLMRAIKLPANTQSEVEEYLVHIQQVPDMQQDMKIFLKLLSPSLRSNILFHIYKSIIRKIPIFDQCSNIELRFIVNFMKTVIFLPDDEIIRQGDKGSKIYFISRGKVDVYIGPDEVDVEYELKRLNSKGSGKSQKSGSVKSALQVVNDGKIIQDDKLETQSIQSKQQQQFKFGHLPGQGLVSVKDEPLSQKDGSAKENYGGSQNLSQKGSNHNNNHKFIKELGEGEYFGEIALLTNLKRTATIKAKDFTTLGYMMQRNFSAAKEEFPQIYQAFKKQIKERYNDENFKFRQQMLRNVPYFKNMNDVIIQELVYLLRPIRYDSNMLIVKRGDSTDKIYFLKAGIVDVEVPLKGDKMHFDSLNTGSCFCIFSAFHDDKKQKFDFRTKTVCVVESISAKDIMALQKQYLELSDELKTLMVQIENNEKSEFDFFRYVPQRHQLDKSVQQRSNIRKKFRMAIAKFFKKLKKSKPIMHVLQLNKNSDERSNREAIYNHIINDNKNHSSEDENDERKHFKALHALDQLEKERKDKEQKLKFLKERCSNPSLFVLSALMGKKTFKDDNEKSKEDQILLNEDSADLIIPPEEHNKIIVEILDQEEKNLMSEESVQMKIQDYPRIDGIREELNKMRKETMMDNIQEGVDLNILKNVSPNFSPGFKSLEKNIKGPHDDSTFIANNPGDSTSNHNQNLFTLSLKNQETIREKMNNDLKINLLDDKNVNNATSPLPIWKSKMNILTNVKVSESEAFKKKIQFDEESFIQKNNLPFSQDVSQLIIKAEDQSKINKSIKDEQNGEDLIKVLNQINQSLQDQQKSMNSLQSDMLKRMGTLEKKLNKAIKIDFMPNNNGYHSKKGSGQYSTFRPRTRDDGKAQLKDDGSERNSKQSSQIGFDNTMGEKRLTFHPSKLGQEYAHSEFQFIKEKQPIQQEEIIMPKNMSTPIQNSRLLINGASEGIGLQNSVKQNQGDSEYSPKAGTNPKLTFDDSDSQDKQQIQKAQNFYLNDQSMSNKNPNTPYFMTEYLETLVDNNNPNKKHDSQNNNEILSDRASTLQKEMATKGPQMNPVIQKKNISNNQKQQVDKKYSKQLSQQPTLQKQITFDNMRNIQHDDSQEIIEINEDEMDQTAFQDHTLIFEDQFEQSLNRHNLDTEKRSYQEQQQQLTPEYLLFNNSKKFTKNSGKEENKNRNQQPSPSMSPAQDLENQIRASINQQQTGSMQQVIQLNELNIIWLPNSIVQFQGTNDIVEAARQQQQQQQQQQHQQQRSSMNMKTNSFNSNLTSNSYQMK